jgi:cation transport regulator ChaC
MQDWDASAGVWRSLRAPTQHILDEDKPVLVFGYGRYMIGAAAVCTDAWLVRGSSLLWKVDPVFQHFCSYAVVARGYKRLLAQRSMDHRGTPDM